MSNGPIGADRHGARGDSRSAKPGQLEVAHTRLAEAVAWIVSGKDWQQMLKFSARFHRYSPGNQLMIWSQNPDATHVAGYRAWEKLGRCVRRGEKGIQILAPIRGQCRTCKSAELVENCSTCERCRGSGRITRFRIAYVFDISQTDGKEFSVEALVPMALEGGAPEELWGPLVSVANNTGFRVLRKQISEGNGYCDFVTRTIAVRPDIGTLQATRTLVHEVAHALCHSDSAEVDQCRQEVEAESTAFVVLNSLGLASDDYSFPYVASWSGGSVDLVNAATEKVLACARDILESLDAARS